MASRISDTSDVQFVDAVKDFMEHMVAPSSEENRALPMNYVSQLQLRELDYYERPIFRITYMMNKTQLRQFINILIQYGQYLNISIRETYTGQHFQEEYEKLKQLKTNDFLNVLHY